MLQLLNVWHMLVQGKYAELTSNKHIDQVSYKAYFMCHEDSVMSCHVDYALTKQFQSLAASPVYWAPVI